MIADRETTTRDTVNPTRMSHLPGLCSACAPLSSPRTAICGAHLRGVRAPDGILDCAVCAELARSGEFVTCVRCGRGLVWP